MAKWSRFLRGPARRSGEPGVGAGGAAGGSGGGGGSPPPASGGDGGTGGQPGPGGTGNEPPKVALDVIPEPLRGLPESQIRFHLGQMAASITAANAKNKALEERLKEKDKAPPRRDPEPPETKTPTKPLGDRLLEEPEAALEDWFGRRAAPVIKELESLREQVGATTISNVRTQFPDWDEHEERVMELLGDGPKTQETIAGAYAMSVGMKVIENRARDQRREAGGSEPPAPDGGTPPKKEYVKSALSEEIRAGLGQTEEEYYEKYRAPMTVKVPT